MNIESAVNDYVASISSAFADRFARLYPNLDVPVVEIEKLRVRYRIVVNEGSSRSVHSFVDFDGNIYKASSWKAPAKGIRGNIFSDSNLNEAGRVKYLR